MSIPYGIGVNFLTGEARLPQFSDYWTDERVRSIMERTEVVQTDEMESLYPESRPVRLVVVTTDGGCHEEMVNYPSGAPENPVSTEQIRTKFEDLSRTALDEDQRTSVLDAVFDIQSVDDVRSVTSQL